MLIMGISFSIITDNMMTVTISINHLIIVYVDYAN